HDHFRRRYSSVIPCPEARQKRRHNVAPFLYAPVSACLTRGGCAGTLETSPSGSQEADMLKGVFLDLSGVLYEGPEPLPGAVDAVSRLQASGLVLRFVTNTSRRGRRQLLADFESMGFAIEPSQLVTAPSVTADWLRSRQRRPYLLMHPDIRHEFADLPQEQPDTVVIGDAEDALNYANLNDAFRLLLDGAELVATGDNR